MRANFTNTLKRALQRHPRAAHPILEVMQVTAQDVIHTQDEWNDADSTGGFSFPATGGIRLSGSATDHFDQSTTLAGADLTNLAPPMSATLDVVFVEWDGDVSALEIRSMTAQLNPNVSGGGGAQEVATWVAQLFRVDRGDDNGVTLAPISSKASVTAGGATTDVTFAFAGAGARPGDPPVTTGQFNVVENTTTVCMIWALQSDGTQAGNVAWVSDSGNSQTTINSHVITRYQLTRLSVVDQETGGTYFVVSTPVTGLPDVKLSGATYSTSGAVIAFSTTSPDNRIDLGAAPGGSTKLQVIAHASEFGGSSVTFEMNDGSGWFTVQDGDVIGEDLTAATPPGSDLSGETRQQTYSMRATLVPNAAGTVTPFVYKMGLAEVTSEYIDDAIVQFGETSWAVDPLTMTSEIPEVEVLIRRDGKRDYRSFVEDLFSTYHIGQLTLRVWLGSMTMARSDWGHVDDFVIDDYEAVGPGLTLYCVSPLSLLLRDIPPEISGTEAVIEYSGATLKAVYDDLVATQIALPARYIGPGVENTTDTVTKTIRERLRGVTAVRQICFLNGGSVISSQGTLKYVDFFNALEPEPEHHFSRDDIEMLGITPGYRARITSYKVGYGWDDRRGTNGAFVGSELASNATALTNLGRALIEINEELDRPTAMWLPTGAATFAYSIAERMVNSFGTGMILWRFRSAVPYPWLEPGDAVTVETDQFVGRDPITGAAIRGPLASLARVQAVHDIEGTEFTVWVQSYDDLTPSQTSVTNTGYEVPEIVQVIADYENDLDMRLSVIGNFDTDNIYVTVGNGSAPADPTAVTNDGSIAGRQGTVTTTISPPALGDDMYVKLVGEGVDNQLGTVFQQRIVRGDIAGSYSVTLRIPATALVGDDEAATWAFKTGAGAAAGYVQPNATASTQVYNVAFPVPEGVTITAVGMRAYRNAVGDTASASFQRVSNTGTLTAVASLTHSTTGWQDIASGSLSETVADPSVYNFAVNLNSTSAIDDARCLYLSVTYLRDSLVQVY